MAKVGTCRGPVQFLQTPGRANLFLASAARSQEAGRMGAACGAGSGCHFRRCAQSALSKLLTPRAVGGTGTRPVSPRRRMLVAASPVLRRRVSGADGGAAEFRATAPG